jgi:hypothetical protein
MRGPPDPEMRRAALADGPKSHRDDLKPDQDTQAAHELQEVFGRRSFVVVHKRRRVPSRRSA